MDCKGEQRFSGRKMREPAWEHKGSMEPPWPECGLLQVLCCGLPGDGLTLGTFLAPEEALLLLFQSFCTEVAADSPHPAGLNIPRNGVQEPHPNQLNTCFPSRIT